MKEREPSALALRATLVLFGVSALLGCSVLEAPVLRSVDGVTTEGRFIEPDAYALYAVAALHEARGRLPLALDMYQRALRIDARGPEIRARIGAVACKMRMWRLADRALADSVRNDPEYGPGWFELSVCRKAQGKLDTALSAAYQALRLDPERYEVSLLAADLEELRGDIRAAWRLRDALATHAPRSLEAQRGLLTAAARHRDGPRMARAETALSELTRHWSPPRPQSGLERALGALRQGNLALAESEAERLLDADPGNGDALIVALLAADLEQDHAAFTRLLEQADHAGTAASPATLTLLSSLLSRRVSSHAGQLLHAPRP